MRLFIAIEIPDDLKKMIAGLREDIPGARWVPEEQIHLTLAFLGEVEDAVFELLNSALAGIHVTEFELCFSATGCFPGRERPRVLWLGVKPHPQLDKLASEVRTAVTTCAIPQEERRFSAHITLARLNAAPSRELDGFIEQPQKQRIHTFRVSEFILFQSRLTQQGAVHIPLRSFLLATV